MDRQTICVEGRTLSVGDPQMQDALGRAHGALLRPLCMCVPAGLEMVVARHVDFVLKRMPGTGSRHNASCPSFAPELPPTGMVDSGGQAVLQTSGAKVQLRVDFAWSRSMDRRESPTQGTTSSKPSNPKRRMGLGGLMRFLFERAGFNRWTPAMAGKRNQAVLHKYLLQAAVNVKAGSLDLSERLYVPEAFCAANMAQVALSRREKLSSLQVRDGQMPLALVLGEFKSVETTRMGHRVWIRHMPDAPLLVTHRSWAAICRRHGALLEAHQAYPAEQAEQVNQVDQANTRYRLRLMMAALIRARPAATCEIDTAALMLTTAQWIPIHGVYELPLVEALVAQQRRFVKSMGEGARGVAAHPSVWLLDVGPAAMPLHVVSACLSRPDQEIKRLALAAAPADVWVWRTGEPMPPFTPAFRR